MTNFFHSNERKQVLLRAWKEVLTIAEAEEKYWFEGFGGGLVVVTRKSDGVRGSLNYTPDYPRYYFDFLAHYAERE